MKRVILFVIMCICVENILAMEVGLRRLGNAGRQIESRVLNPQMLQAPRVGMAARGMATAATEAGVQPTLSWWQRFKTRMESPLKKLGEEWQQFRTNRIQERKRLFEVDVAHEMEKLRNILPNSSNATFGELNSGNLGRVQDALRTYRNSVNSGTISFLPEYDLKRALEGINRPFTQTARNYFKTEAFSDAQREAYKRLMRAQMRRNNTMKKEILGEISQNQFKSDIASKMKQRKMVEMLENHINIATRFRGKTPGQITMPEMVKGLTEWKELFIENRKKFIEEFGGVVENLGLKEAFDKQVLEMGKNIEKIDILKLRMQEF